MTNSEKAKKPTLRGSKKLALSSAVPKTHSEKAKKPTLRGSKKLALSSPVLNRTTFETSRAMDFFSEKELVTQTGHERNEWPLVFVKEGIDNSLDACEEASIAPTIDVIADAAGITVQDNGLGLPESTLAAALDFTVRASNREAYVAPDRGAQGNALKTLLAMPLVVDPTSGKLIVAAHGKHHSLRCSADPLTQQAVVQDDVLPTATTGTTLRMQWGGTLDSDLSWPFDEDAPPPEGRIRAMVEAFALFNPHATFRLDWFGSKTTWKATLRSWEKWKPNKPTSPHWYELAHLERLIAAYIAHDRAHGADRLVSDFLAEFDGLSGSAKRTKVLTDAQMKRAKLSELASSAGLDHSRIQNLLTAMQKHTRIVVAPRLGVIGEVHFRKRLVAMGVQPDSFRYSKKLGQGSVPWVLESAFGWLGPTAPDQRRIFAGANWSAAIKNPFRSFGTTGEGLETVLSEMRATRHEPIVFVLHLAHPRVEYTDRGKSALVLGGAA